ncbi:MAG: GH25 family lysozyme [Oscillospiraceae bacterium]|nr:GH25 family lysozyme [Oscillospiraceae bacterium]
MNILRKRLITAAAGIVILTASLMGQSVNAVKATELGIDISKYQGNINFSQLTTNDIKFVILRAGTTKYGIDAKYEEYYKGLQSTNLKVGAYLFCSSTTLEGFKADAETFIKYLKGKDMKMPVYIDLESDEQMAVGKQALTTYTIAALNILREAGYTAGVYSNKYWYTNYVDRQQILDAGYEIWWAQYPTLSNPINPGNYSLSNMAGMWQYSSQGKLNGIPDNTVDLNIAYKIYPENKPDNKIPEEQWYVTAMPTLRLRCGAGVSFGSIGAVPTGTILRVNEKKQAEGYTWGKVTYNGYVGWCALDYAINLSAQPDTDLNGDGKKDINDYYELKKYLLEPDKEYNKKADLNGDGVINVFDCQYLKSKLFG